MPKPAPFDLLSAWLQPRSARRPSRIGLIVTFCLLTGLLIWRFALPDSPVWLDLLALACVGAVLLTVRRALRDRGAPDRERSP